MEVGSVGSFLHIYPQEYWHCDALVVANRDGLLSLQKAVDAALAEGIGKTDASAADGEGYATHVILLDNADQGAWQRLRMPYIDEVAIDRRENCIHPDVLLQQRRDAIGKCQGT